MDLIFSALSCMLDSNRYTRTKYIVKINMINKNKMTHMLTPQWVT